MDKSLIIVAVILAWVIFWMAIMKAIGHFGGWSALAEAYEAREDFQGKRWRFESGRFLRRANYSGCLTFGANARGLHLSAFFPFRIGHPALFIPWNDVTMARKTYWMFPYVEFRFRRVPDRPLLVRQKLGEKLAAEAGLPWPPPEESK